MEIVIFLTNLFFDFFYKNGKVIFFFIFYDIFI